MKTIRLHKNVNLTASQSYILRTFYGVDIIKRDGRYELRLAPEHEVKTINLINTIVHPTAKHA